MEIDVATKGLLEGPLDAPLAGASVYMKAASLRLQLHQHPTFMSLWSEQLEPWLINSPKYLYAILQTVIECHLLGTD